MGRPREIWEVTLYPHFPDPLQGSTTLVACSLIDFSLRNPIWHDATGGVSVGGIPTGSVLLHVSAQTLSLHASPRTLEALRGAFDEADADGDGCISACISADELFIWTLKIAPSKSILSIKDKRDANRQTCKFRCMHRHRACRTHTHTCETDTPAVAQVRQARSHPENKRDHWGRDESDLIREPNRRFCQVIVQRESPPSSPPPESPEERQERPER